MGAVFITFHGDDITLPIKRCNCYATQNVSFGVTCAPDVLMPTLIQRRLPVGAEVCRQYGVHFRVWAPRRKTVEVVMDRGRSLPLDSEGNGYFSGLASTVTEGMRYQFRLDNGDALLPDPASRYQPDGPHGASQVIAPDAFPWTDERWRGIRIEGQIF